MKNKFYLLFVSFLFINCFTSCNNDTTAPTQSPLGEQPLKLADILDSLRYEFDLPALGAAIITANNILDAQAVGCRRYGGEQNITNNDQFHIGSNTKAMTSALMGIFVDEGKIDWSTTLKDIFPEFEENMRDEYRDVTVRDLLAHSGGFVRESGVYPVSGTPKEKRLEVVRWAIRQPHAAQRGVHLYSNVGYIIAGAIIEKMAGGQYEELLIERILSPLGVTTAGFGAMGTPGIEDQPLQHRVNSAGEVTVIHPGPGSDNPEIYSPAGRLHLSVGDWAKYIQFVLQAETGNSGLITAQTAAELTSKVVRMGGETYYGYGWVNFETEWGGDKTLFHNGSNTKNYSEAWLALNKDFAVIVVTNQYGGNTDTYISTVVERLIDFYLENN
jgi:CubicO group peptidase (beta-lactamase class C family)